VVISDHLDEDLLTGDFSLGQLNIQLLGGVAVLITMLNGLLQQNMSLLIMTIKSFLHCGHYFLPLPSKNFGYAIELTGGNTASPLINSHDNHLEYI
jgi:hypothetical protein